MSDKRKYRKFTARQKTELVLARSRGERSIAEICREHELSETLRPWRDQMVEAGLGRYQAGQDRSLVAEQRRRIAQLERALGKKTMGLEIAAKLWLLKVAHCGTPRPAQRSVPGRRLRKRRPSAATQRSRDCTRR